MSVDQLLLVPAAVPWPLTLAAIISGYGIGLSRGELRALEDCDLADAEHAARAVHRLGRRELEQLRALAHAELTCRRARVRGVR